MTPAPEIVDGIALTTHEPPPGVERRPHPIVFVHGGCHGSWAWANWQTWFAQRGWSSTALDWRSHGASDVLPREQWLRRTITEVADDVEVAVRVASERAGAAPVLVGHSMGGLASLTYAAATDRDLAALALLAPVVDKQNGGAPVELEIDMAQPWGPPPLEVSHQLFFSGVDDATAAELFARLQPESPAAVYQGSRWTADVDTSGLSAPSLVVAAEKDLLVPAPYVQSLGRAIHAEQIFLDGVGHGVILDPGWEALAERVEAWLAGAVGTRATAST